jgi:hypothetical protein
VHDLADTLRAAGVLPTLHNGRSGSFDPREHRFSEPERLAELDGLEGADYLATASSIGAGIYSNEEVCGRNRTNRRRASWAA